MNILMTGATGFVGRKVMEILMQENPQSNIILITNKTVEGHLCIEHDNYKISRKKFDELEINHIDIVLHLGAAVPDIAENWTDNGKYIRNIESTYNMIQELPNIPKKFIYISSVDIYKYMDMCVDEQTEVEPTTPYGMSKAMCELLLKQWAMENNVDLTILRLGSCYGAGDKRMSLIPNFVKKVKKYQSIQIYSDGKEHRCYVHVKDAAKAICNAIHLQNVPIINVVGDRRYTINYIAETIALFQKDYDKQLIQVKNEKKRTRDDYYNNELMKKYLLEKQIPFEEGLLEEYNDIS